MKMRADEKAWTARAELKRPLSERLSEVFYGFLKSPAQRLVGSLKGISTDLYRANLSITPEKFAALLIGLSLCVTIFAVVFLLLLGASLILIPLVAIMAFAFTFMFAKSYPKRKAKGRSGEVNKLIPYALRHMATQLSSGIGLPETMTSVSNAGYGALSEEFGMAIQDMNTGMSLEEALTEMDERLNSEPLRRALRQILRTLRIGGDLSHTLNTLADETAFEMRAKLKDYVQSLNMFTMIYMFMSAVIPAMFMVVIMISSSGGKSGISPQVAGVLYLVVLPFLLVYFVMMIKRFEPRL
jgi:flagellar protein FlaJ